MAPDLKKEARNSSSEEELDEAAYLHRNLSANECDSDSLEGEMNLSDDESQVKQRMQIKA